MFILNPNIKILNKSIKIIKADCSLSKHHVSSSKGYTDEAIAYLIQGTIKGTPVVYAVLQFQSHNDIYISDELLDIDLAWNEGVDFLQELGFYLDKISEDDIKQRPIFNEPSLHDKEIEDILGDVDEDIPEKNLNNTNSLNNNSVNSKQISPKDKNEIVTYLSFY